jgi:hypothetical protein
MKTFEIATGVLVLAVIFGALVGTSGGDVSDTSNAVPSYSHTVQGNPDAGIDPRDVDCTFHTQADICLEAGGDGDDSDK